MKYTLIVRAEDGREKIAVEDATGYDLSTGLARINFCSQIREAIDDLERAMVVESLDLEPLPQRHSCDLPPKRRKR